MGILITILIIIGSLVALFLIIAALTPKTLNIEKKVSINRSKTDVFNYVRLLKNQEYYSIWVMRDPNIKLTYTGVDGTVGAVSAWTSDDKKVGVGSQEIIETNGADRMKVEVRFVKPFESTLYSTTHVSGDAQRAEVMMVINFTASYPRNFMNLFVGKMVGKDIEQNLANLKVQLEK